MRRIAVCGALAFLVSCVSSAERERLSLDRDHPPRSARVLDSTSALYYVGAVRFGFGRRPDAFAEEALRGMEGLYAVGYDRYQGVRDLGVGQAARQLKFCDYVFFDREDRILASRRRTGGC